MNQIPQAKRAATRVAFIQARWHADIVDQCRRSFVSELDRLGGDRALVDVYDVPGAFEIPLLARTLARQGRYSAIVGCALVVDGGIYRHEFVAQTVVTALMQVQMEVDLPVLSAVLTPHHFNGEEHHRFFLEHFAVKGREVANACSQILATHEEVVAAA